MVKGFSKTQIALHWAVAALILFQLIFGESMTDVWRAFRKSGAMEQTTMSWAHIVAGVLILAFAAWRLLLRATRGAPAAPEGDSAPLKIAGAVVHWALYALMIGAPITGLLAFYGGFVDLAELHEAAKPALIILIGLHVVAALWHQFYLKDNLLDRMRTPQD
jgi:cytochrome b561